MAVHAPARVRCPGPRGVCARNARCALAAAAPRAAAPRDPPPARSLRGYWPLNRRQGSLGLPDNANALLRGGLLSGQEEVDIVLSSGFLAFAYHAGFLAAVEEAGLQARLAAARAPRPQTRGGTRLTFRYSVPQVGGVMGTSAGALTGALYAAGYKPQDVATILSERTPLSYLVRRRAQPLSARSRPSRRTPRRSRRPSRLCAFIHSLSVPFASQCLNEEPWTGALRLDGAVARLRELLPPTFAGLQRRYACGVVDATGRHRTLSSGPLPEAVVASMAIPCLFRAVAVPDLEDGPFKDGGKADRVGLLPWLAEPALATPGRTTICHVIARSSPFSGADDVLAMSRKAPPQAGPIVVCRSPKSDQSLLGLPDFEPQFLAARDRAAKTLARAQGGAVTAR